MKTNLFVGLLTIFFSGILYAQEDSLAAKQILLKEVIIQQGSTNTTNRLFKPGKDGLRETDQILNDMSGVSIIKRGNYAWEPGIRGLSAGRIVTTIDGMAIFGACTDRMDPVSSYIEPVNLKSIVISYGNNGNLSGNSIGGGFDFKINQPSFSTKKVLTGMVASGYESNGHARQISTILNYGTPRLGININGIYRASGNYKAGKGEVIPYSQYSKWNGGIGLKYKINPHQSLWINYIRDEGYNIGYPSLTMDVLYAKASIFSLTHQWHVSSDIVNRLESKIYFNTINHAMDDTKRPIEEVFMHMDMPGTSQTAGFRSAADATVKNHRIRAEVHFYENKLHAEMTMYPEQGAPMFMLTLPDGKRQFAELNLNDEWRLNNRWLLQSGLSISIAGSGIYTNRGKETLSSFFNGQEKRTDFIPAFYINPVYNIGNLGSLFASAGYSSRTPTLQELYGFYLFNRSDNFDYLGNPALKNESSLNLSAGMTIKKEKFKITTRLFSYFMQNYIAGRIQNNPDKMTHSASGVKQFENLKNAYLLGFETDAEWKINKWLLWETGNSFSYGKDANAQALPFIPPFRTLNRMTVTMGKNNISPEIVYRSPQRHISDAYGESPTPASLILNLFWNRNFIVGSGRFHIQAGVENIMDSRYFDHNDGMKVLRPGRNIKMKVFYYF